MFSNVVVDVLGNDDAVFRGHGFEVLRGEDGIRGEVGEFLFVDDLADAAIGDVGLEVSLDRRDGLGFVRLVVGDELGELLLQQFILGFEARE